MFFKPKKNHRIKEPRQETMLEIAIGAITLALMGYVLTVAVFLL